MSGNALLKEYHESVKKAAKELIAKKNGGGLVLLQKLQESFQQHFSEPSLSSVREAYRKEIFGDVAGAAGNKALESTIETTQDAVQTVLDHYAVAERYVTLHLPKMEDGNNFGVTVQLALLKQMTDSREKIVKELEDVTKSYHKDRADAVEKCKYVPPASTVKTTTSVQAETNGTDSEKGSTNSSENKKVVEDKQVLTVADAGGQSLLNPNELALRHNAVLSVDVLYYHKCKNLYNMSLTGYMALLDFFDKNQTKIDQPKGSQEGRSAYSSMY